MERILEALNTKSSPEALMKVVAAIFDHIDSRS
jgi:hypothetical protein